ncbi:helix-turn-helix transcriptional regulator [Erysipelothrix sp. HDW6C]|uniref:helix-turn-helix domain-containing protein n=1 Tax=Erysipelothrix sp. HDW6C TaxID=2714930 RepID=UPI001409AC1B|nr:helix-turn-helix transcriptional regulator [Erysipelothrix sp. HDW6C]QIK68968.1 helix-turn-helix transcriptional regulator [Erysipelothrix sp. HDW6C]
MKISHNVNTFDMNHLGKVIATQRKQRNLTQGELAETLGVSHQAVSSWENGLTSPDIGKLSELSQIFSISIDELLGNVRMAESVRKVEKNEPLNEKELIDIAPITKPDLFEKVFSKVDPEEFTVESLIAIAPFMESDQIKDWILENIDRYGIRDIVPLVAFIDEEDLGMIIGRLEQREDFKLKDIIPFAPFMDAKTIDKLFTDAHAKSETEGIEGLYPFLEEDALHKHVENTLSQPNARVEGLIPLAPFVDEETVKLIVDYLIREKRMAEITPFVVFL